MRRAVALVLLAGATASAGVSVTRTGTTFTEEYNSPSTVSWTTLDAGCASAGAVAYGLTTFGGTRILATRGFGFSIPAGSNITGVRIAWFRNPALDGAIDSRVGLLLGAGTSQTATALILAAGKPLWQTGWGRSEFPNTTYNVNDTMWGSPDWLTPGNVSDPLFGVYVVIANSVEAGNNITIRCVNATVEYDPPPTTGTTGTTPTTGTTGTPPSTGTTGVGTTGLTTALSTDFATTRALSSTAVATVATTALSSGGPVAPPASSGEPPAASTSAGVDATVLAMGIALGSVCLILLLAVVPAVYTTLKRRRARAALPGEDSLSADTTDGEDLSDVSDKTPLVAAAAGSAHRWAPPAPGHMRIVMDGEIEVGKEIGRGAHGSVYLATMDGSTNVACKALSAADADRAEMMREISMVQRLRHPHVVQFFGIYIRNDTPYLVMEYVEGGALNAFLRAADPKLDSHKLILICLGVCGGMRFVAQSGIVHRDLAARNLLVAPKDGGYIAKITDFGLSLTVATDKQYARVSLVEHRYPVRWSAPEVMQTARYSEKSDIWSFGVTMWEIFSHGDLPYQGMDNGDVTHWVPRGRRLERPAACPTDMFEKALLPCWKADPDDRPTFADLCDDIRSCLVASARRQDARELAAGGDEPVYNTAPALSDTPGGEIVFYTS